MKFRFLDPAEAEFKVAAAFYESREANLGADYILEVHETIDRILEYPEAWPEVEPEVRRCLVGRFPYGVLYSMDHNEIVILAVMHLRRDPDYWRDRTSDAD